eukprot:1167074-Pyramimonas_sp.AAC.1
MRGEGIYLQQGGPIRRGESIYTHRADQSDEGRGYIPTGRTRVRSFELTHGVAAADVDAWTGVRIGVGIFCTQSSTFAGLELGHLLKRPLIVHSVRPL